MNIVTQTDALSRLLESFGSGREKERPQELSYGERNTAVIDVGCVDWYLYPVNREARQPEG